jgi:SAM-dependent methyltransferase
MSFGIETQTFHGVSCIRHRILDACGGSAGTLEGRAFAALKRGSKDIGRMGGQKLTGPFERLVEEAEAQAFSGWDFSYLNGRWHESDTSWDYPKIVTDRLRSATSLLDMGTGGGELLASLAPLPAHVCATEGYPPNLGVARARLEPIGVSVHAFERDDALPFADAAFDLILNRHESFSAQEVYRILRPGGVFLTQQVGGHDCIRLNEWLQVELDKPYLDWSLPSAARLLGEAGFTLTRQQEEFPETRFLDIGAVVYYLKIIAWQVPGFTVRAYRNELLKIDEVIRSDGYFAVQSDRFLIEAHKQRV